MQPPIIVFSARGFLNDKFSKAKVSDEWSYFFRAGKFHLESPWTEILIAHLTVFVLEADSDPVLAKPAIIPSQIYEATISVVGLLGVPVGRMIFN
jgi:hypothetical protein